MEKITQAIIFATNAFDGQVRKGEGVPAILHSLEAASIAQTLTKEEDIVVSAVLHDTVEDAGIALSEIERLFGKRVAELVASETENKRVGQDPKSTWRIRKQESIDVLTATKDLGVKILYLSDKLSNVRSLYRLKQKFGEDMWNGFHQKDTSAQKWYYESIKNAFAELADTLAFKEYSGLVDKIFKEKE